jgi:hypothetical protein
MGENYDVILFDRQWHEQSRGQMHVSGPIPIAAVELKTNSTSLPKDLRDKWDIGIVCSDGAKPDTASIRGKLFPDGLKHEEGDILVAPIVWDKYGDQYIRRAPLFYGDDKAIFEFR